MPYAAKLTENGRLAMRQRPFKFFDTMGMSISCPVMNVLLAPHQEKFIGNKMKGGGYLSPDEVVREALRVCEHIEQEDNDPLLEAELRHGLRSRLKKYKSGHFAALAIESD
jgi:putative addiction module CopG family antidote